MQSTTQHTKGEIGRGLNAQPEQTQTSEWHDLVILASDCELLETLDRIVFAKITYRGLIDDIVTELRTRHEKELQAIYSDTRELVTWAQEQHGADIALITARHITKRNS